MYFLIGYSLIWYIILTINTVWVKDKTKEGYFNKQK